MNNILSRALCESRSSLDEVESKEWLRNNGIQVPEFRRARDEREALEATSEIGFPVTVKVCSPEITHKSGWQEGIGVAVNLQNRDEVREAAGRIFENGQDQSVDVLVEEHLETRHGWEIIVGGQRKPAFGPVLMLGAGGILAEWIDDVGFLLAPFTVDEAMRVLQDLACVKMFSGFRERNPVDRESFLKFLVHLGNLLVETEEIFEMDLNPVLVQESQQTVLDASLFLQKQNSLND